MFIRTTQLIAFILMLLISLQSVAAANVSICNSMMQAQLGEQNATAMSCHQHMAGMSKAIPNQHGCADKTICKTICATLCASFSAMAAIPNDIRPVVFSAASSSMRMLHQSYTSVTLPNLQRPPIFLS